MKKMTRILVTHGICGLMGFVAATAIMAGQEKPDGASLEELGVVVPPDTHFVDGVLTAPRESGLVNYELAPPSSQLSLVELGGGADGAIDTWIVSCMNGLEPPKIDAPLGFVGMYFDRDGTGSPERLLLSVGDEAYQYILRRPNGESEEIAPTDETLAIYIKGKAFTAYYDFDKDGSFDYITERPNAELPLNSESPSQSWLVWSRIMYEVKEKHDSPDGSIYEIEDPDGGSKFVRLSGAVWEETRLN